MIAPGLRGVNLRAGASSGVYSRRYRQTAHPRDAAGEIDRPDSAASLFRDQGGKPTGRRQRPEPGSILLVKTIELEAGRFVLHVSAWTGQCRGLEQLPSVVLVALCAVINA
jgi:hypothetical protein